jgi:hypothetical protein
MNDLRTRAYLVDFDRAGAVGTIVPRAEIAEAAAGTEFPATLVLDLARVEAESGGEGTAHATVAVEWDQPTLEQLLAATEDQEIELRFDERELVMAFDDVEGHGIRERAAVLAVAVAAAGASSSPALARVAADTGGGGAGATASSVAVNSQTGVPAVPVGGAERALAQEEKLTQGLETGQSAVTSTSGESTPSTSGPVIASRGAERALQQDEKLSSSTSQGSGSAASSSGDTSLSTGELAGAIAGGALLIAAAGFGATRRRTPPALPA